MNTTVKKPVGVVGLGAMGMGVAYRPIDLAVLEPWEKELYDIPHTIYPFVMGSRIMENKSVSKIPDIIKERHL